MSQSLSPIEVQQRVLRWSYVLSQQIDRLRAARQHAADSQHERLRTTTNYGTEDAHPFFMLEAERHFVLVAARQLLRALNAFDGDDRLPSQLPADHLRNVRDALEHWDEPQGRAASKMREAGANPAGHTWKVDGSGVLGDLLNDSELKAWAQSVYDEVVGWNPWDPQPTAAP